VYKSKRFTSEQAATGLVIRFAGQLKNCWDNFLDPKTRDEILNHSYRRIDDQGNKEIIQDGPDLLIHIIALHFIGSPKGVQALAKTILINLRRITFGDCR